MSEQATSPESRLSLAEARNIVKDLFQPKASIYWTDFLVTWAVGILCYSIARGAPLMARPDWNITWPRVLCFLVSCLCFYRMVLFTHELVHLPQRHFKGFRFIWNALCGIPMLIPSFTYYTHNSHHRRRMYGTERDGEYLPLTSRSPWYMLFYLSWNFIIPPLVVIRFALLTPISWLSPRFRNFLHQRMSSMVIDPSYIRPLPTKATLRIIRLQEVLCFAWIWTLAVAATVVAGGVPTFLILHIYSTAVVVAMINAIRTLGAHRYVNSGQEEMTFEEQLLDSLNFPKRWLITELWGPTGTRYHALHHLFPTMPYHALPEAHRRLMQSLPENSPYRETERESLTGELVSLWRRAGQKKQAKPADSVEEHSRAA